MSTDLDRPLFSERYGIGRNAHAASWTRRHLASETPVERHGCRCPGARSADEPCAQSCTEEDLLCDECREFCICIDSAKVFHLIADTPAFVRSGRVS